MFPNTKVHETKIDGYQYALRTGIQIPDSAVNLAYYYNRPLDPQENIVIADTSKFVIENLNQVYDNEVIMYPDTSGTLTTGTASNLDSNFFEITDKFYDNTPLYYRYKLKHKCYSQNEIDSMGRYNGKSISILDYNMKPVNKKKYKYTIFLKATSDADIYEVYIYTSFKLQNNKKIYCSYNAVVDKTVNGIPSHDIMIDTIEYINPEPFFKKGRDYSVIRVDDVYTNIQITNVNRIQDTRNKLECHYIVTTDDGSYSSASYPAFVVRKDYAFKHEVENYLNNLQVISNKTAKELILANNPGLDASALDDKIIIVNFDTLTTSPDNQIAVNLVTDPNGDSLVYAETLLDTGADDNGSFTKIIDLPDLYYYSGTEVVSKYAVRKKDHRQVKIEPPKETDVLENWYPRVKSGRFTKTTIGQSNRTLKLYYQIPEYDKQPYSSLYDKPYIDITNEVPEIINSNMVKTKFTPLYVDTDDIDIKNLVVKRKNAFGDIEKLSIVTWNSEDGCIMLDSSINDNDQVTVDYTYEEQCLTYRGYLDPDYKEFFNMDLNPNQYHTMKVIRNGLVYEDKVYTLFNKIVYVYMRPYKVTNMVDGTETTIQISNSVIYHSLDEEPNDINDIMIGKLYLKHNTTIENTELIDTRSGGGGVAKDMYDPLRKVLEPQSDYFLDIGYWDGEPYNENAVVIIRLDKKILKENGGKFTVQEVEAGVNKWIAIGVLPIIEYVTTYGEEDSPNNNLIVDNTRKNKLDYTPIFSVEMFKDVKVETPILQYNIYKYKPCGIINVDEYNIVNAFFTNVDSIFSGIDLNLNVTKYEGNFYEKKEDGYSKSQLQALFNKYEDDKDITLFLSTVDTI